MRNLNLVLLAILVVFAAGCPCPHDHDFEVVENPALVGELEMPMGDIFIEDLAVSNGYVFTASSSSHYFHVFDVSDPAMPALVFRAPEELAKIALDICVAEGYAYLVYPRIAGIDLEVWDINDPTAPVSVGSFRDDTTYYKKVAVENGIACLMGVNKITVLDVSDSADVVAMSTIEDLWPNDVALDNAYLYLIDENEGLLIFDLFNPSEPEFVASYNFSGYGPSALAVSGQNVYTEGGRWLYAFDVSDPTVPTRIGSYYGRFDAEEMYVRGRYLYVNRGLNGGLEIFDVSDPTVPTAVGKIEVSYGAICTDVSGHYAYISAGNILRVFDLALEAQ